MKKLSIFILTLATAILMASCDGKKDESIKNEISQKATEVKTDIKDAAEDIKEKADFVTDDNNHNGIAKALKKFVI